MNQQRKTEYSFKHIVFYEKNTTFANNKRKMCSVT